MQWSEVNHHAFWQMATEAMAAQTASSQSKLAPPSTMNIGTIASFGPARQQRITGQPFHALLGPPPLLQVVTAISVARHDILQKDSDRYDQQLSLCKFSLLLALDQATKDKILAAHGVLNFLSISVEDIAFQLDIYARPFQSNIITKQFEILRAIGGEIESVEEFAKVAAGQVAAYKVLQQANVIIDSTSKFMNLLDSVIGSPCAAEGITAYYRAFPVPALRTFDTLRTFLDQSIAIYYSVHKSNLQAMAATSHRAGTSHGALSHEKEIEALKAKILHLEQNKNKSKTPSQTKSKSGKEYCWTHGTCMHASKDCREPAAKHKNNATMQNNMDGNPFDKNGPNNEWRLSKEWVAEQK